MEENMVVIRNRKTFYFDLDGTKDFDANLKHDIEIEEAWKIKKTKNNHSLGENKIKKEIEQMLFKYNHRILL